MDSIRRLLILIVIFTMIYNIIPIITVTHSKATLIGDVNVAKTIQVSRGSTANAKNFNLTIDSDLRIKSNLTPHDYDRMLKNTELKNLGKAFYEAEQKHNVNGLYLMGLACLESAYGTSGYARKRNNLVGWNAVDSNPNKASYFDSKEECILFVAGKLKINYLTENGAYFEGYTAKDVDKHYCTDKLHARKIVNIVNKLVKEV